MMRREALSTRLLRNRNKFILVVKLWLIIRIIKIIREK